MILSNSPFEDIQVKLMLPHCKSNALALKIKKNMRELRKNNIHLWITRMYKSGGMITIEMRGARIVNVPKWIEAILPNKLPKKFSLLAKIDKDEDILEFLYRKRQSIKKYCRTSISTSLVGFSKEEGDDKVLVILLVEMTS